MIDQQRIRQALRGSSLQPCTESWLSDSISLLQSRRHGDRDRWMRAVAKLPAVEGTTTVNLDQPAVTVAGDKEIPESVCKDLSEQLMVLHPWRKGPFNLFGVEIDSEWRSDWKWQRIAGKISSLEDRQVLDVGCGNGYYLFRMLGDGAKLAVGIDPTQLFLAQFAAVNRYVNTNNAFVLPMKSDEFSVGGILPVDHFDSVFSMGVYYHRKQPQEHLAELYEFLRPGGELIIETLVIDSDEDAELLPENRYAQMRNVWSLPSVFSLSRQLEACGFVNPEVIDLTATTIEEQRATPWMTFDSLSDFLDPRNPALTVEGYPAPIRGCMIATRPE